MFKYILTILLSLDLESGVPQLPFIPFIATLSLFTNYWHSRFSFRSWYCLPTSFLVCSKYHKKKLRKHFNDNSNLTWEIYCLYIKVGRFFLFVGYSQEIFFTSSWQNLHNKHVTIMHFSRTKNSLNSVICMITWQIDLIKQCFVPQKSYRRPIVYCANLLRMMTTIEKFFHTKSPY